MIEFSVQDPPAGLVSWRFQLLEPSEGGASDLAPLQEVLGGSPVFHQIYWNGRRNYFGSPLAPGRYDAVLTATGQAASSDPNTSLIDTSNAGATRNIFVIGGGGAFGFATVQNGGNPVTVTGTDNFGPAWSSRRVVVTARAP